MVKIFHYRDKCIGCYYCVELAPQRWEMNEDDGKSTLIDATEKKGIFIVNVPDFELQENIDAQNACPVNCIKVEKIK